MHDFCWRIFLSENLYQSSCLRRSGLGGGYWSKNPISARRNQTPQEKLRCDGCSKLEWLQFTNIWITEVWTGILGVGCSAS